MAGKFFDDLVFKVIADTKGAVEGLQKLGDKAQQLNKHAKASGSGVEAMFSKAKVGAAIAATAFVAAGAAALKFGLSAATAAGQAEMENNKLSLTLKNVAGATDEVAASMVEYIQDLSLASGVVSSKLSPALEALARSTRNVESAQKLLGLAMDVSAGTGVDLQSVSIALGEAYKGNYTMLTRLRTGLSSATLESKDFKKISAELAALFEGQADLAANSYQGSISRMSIAFSQMKESIGTMLIPVFQLFIDIMNNALIPAIRNWLKNAQKNPEIANNMVKSMARVINVFKDTASIALSLGGAFLLVVSALTRLVQGLGWLIEITGGSAGKGIKDWGRNTSEALVDMANSFDKAAKALSKFDANKYVRDFDFSKVKLPTLDLGGGITGGSGKGDKEKAKLASDWNDAAKAILNAVKTIRDGLKSVTQLDIRKMIADLSLDPLVVSMRDAIDATKDYVSAQNDLVAKTKESAKADEAYVRSMLDISEKGKAKTNALRDQVARAKDAAIASAQTANEALQRIADAQKRFVDETITRIKNLRDAFKSATQVSLGGIATSISDAKRNIETAKQNLANAEKALLDAQNKFKNNATAQAYEGVILKTSLPIFEAEKEAVEKAKRDLAIALGEEKNPYAATAEELLKALKKAYDDAVSLSKVSGDLAALGFSQDFITQIIEAGPDLGTELGRAILGADPYTQAAMIDIFDNIQTISETGVNQLSIDLNQGAIDAMDAFIKGLKTVEDPLEKLMKAIEDRVEQMVSTIKEAIAAILAQLAALQQIPITQVPIIQLPGNFPNQKKILPPDKAAQDAANAFMDAERARIEAEKALAESEAALARTRYSIDRSMASGVAGWRMGENRSMEGFNITVNANTNADPYDIAMATAFAIKTKSDGSFKYGAGASNR